MKKITDKIIAEFFNTTPQTLGNWKRSKDIRLNERYRAYRKWVEDKNITYESSYFQCEKGVLHSKMERIII